jgi:hypothetical protein
VTGKWGYIDKTGKVVIEPQFNYASSFSEGLANITIEGKDAFIDKTGKIVINVKQEGFFWPFSDGFSLGMYGDEYFYIDKTGKEAFGRRFGGAGVFSEGLAAVVIDDAGTKRWAFIDTAGNIVINTHSDTVSYFSEGLAVVGTQDETGYMTCIDRFNQFGFSKGPGSPWPPTKGKLGYIDKTGKVVIEQQFDRAHPFSEGLAGVWMDGKPVFIDKTGNIVITPQCDAVSSFSDGVAAVGIGDKWGYIDRTGKIVINPQFYDAGAFLDGLAPIRLDRSVDLGRYAYIDKEGKIVWTPDIVPSSEEIYYFILFTIPESIAGFFMEAFRNSTNSQL